MRDMIDSGFVQTGQGSQSGQAGQAGHGSQAGQRGQARQASAGAIPRDGPFEDAVGKAPCGSAVTSTSVEAEVRWRIAGFDHAGSCYGFETTLSGDRSRIVINGKAALELPRAVWHALIDAASLQRQVGQTSSPKA